MIASDFASLVDKSQLSTNGNKPHKPTLQLGSFTITSTGLTVQGKPTYQEWFSFGETLKFLESSIQFALGDWLNYGEHAYGEKYSQALEETDYRKGTLKDFSWVAKNVKSSLRKDDLTFSHHKEVANLHLLDDTPDIESQRHFLDVAVKEGLSVVDLRLRIRQDTHIQQRQEAFTVQEDNCTQHLIQGDMLDILPALSERFDLVIADPPYNVTEWEWDKRGDSFLEETRDWLTACLAVCKPEYNLFWFASPAFMADIEMVIRDLKMPIQSRIVWHRRNMAKGSDAKFKFIDSYEMIFHIGNKPLNFPSIWDDSRFDVQTFAVPQTNFTDMKLHPTQKPLALIQRLIEFASYSGDMVLDPFAGSGTTGDACSNNRSFVLVEKEAEYINVIAKRLNILPE